MGIGVRHALPSDIEWLTGELKEFSKLHGTKKPLFTTEEIARQVLEVLIDKHLFFIAERKEDLQRMGFICGMIGPQIFNPEIRVLQETFWWVSAQFRKTRAGLLLLNALVTWGRSNVDWIAVALEPNSPINERSLTKRGFKVHERFFLMEVA